MAAAASRVTGVPGDAAGSDRNGAAHPDGTGAAASGKRPSTYPKEDDSLVDSDDESYDDEEDDESDEPLQVELTNDGGVRCVGQRRHSDCYEAGFDGDSDSSYDSYTSDDDDDEAIQPELVDGGARRGIGNVGSSDDEYYDDEEESEYTSSEDMDRSGAFQPIAIDVVRGGGQRYVRAEKTRDIQADMELDSESEDDDDMEEAQNTVLVRNLVSRLRNAGEVDLREFRDIDWDDPTFSNEINLLKLLEGLTAQKAELMGARTVDLNEVAQVEFQIKEAAMTLEEVKPPRKKRRSIAKKTMVVEALPDDVADEIKEDDAQQTIADTKIVPSSVVEAEKKKKKGRRKREPKQRAEVSFKALPDEDQQNTEIVEDNAEQQIGEAVPGAAASREAGAKSDHRRKDARGKKRRANPRRSLREVSISQIPDDIGGEIKETVEPLLTHTPSFLASPQGAAAERQRSAAMARRASSMKVGGDPLARRRSRTNSVMAAIPEPVTANEAEAIPDVLAGGVSQPKAIPVPQPPATPAPHEKKKRVRKTTDRRKNRELSFGALPEDDAGEIREEVETTVLNDGNGPSSNRGPESALRARRMSSANNLGGRNSRRTSAVPNTTGVRTPHKPTTPPPSTNHEL